MKLEIGSKIHNRFDIEVRDFKTGELKKKGQAENIILDRIYTRLCNFSSYFSYIHFGQGTGVLDPSRTILFDELGYKSAVTEEILKDFPISKWTRKIVLNPEEYVGESIKEVGISDDYSSTKSKSYINTHALIKDAEGNQLSIEKTDTDVVVIYATVFIELQNKSNNIRFTDLLEDNKLLNYLLGSSAPSSIIQLDSYFGDGFSTTVGYELDRKIATRNSDIANKKIVYNTRFGISEGNGEVSRLALQGVFACNLPEINVFTGKNLIDMPVGIGSGVDNLFEITHNRIKNLTVKIDGNIVTNYNINTEGLGYSLPLATKLRNAPLQVFILRSDPLIIVFHYYDPGTWAVNSSAIIFGDGENLKMQKLTSGISGGLSAVKLSADYKYLQFSHGSVRQYELMESSCVSITIPAEVVLDDISATLLSEEDVLVEGLLLQSKTIPVAKWVPDGKSIINFNTPPPEGAIITADYTVPYIPKTEDYVLDVTMEIQFGEGV